jgi:hypothetical protein
MVDLRGAASLLRAAGEEAGQATEGLETASFQVYAPKVMDTQIDKMFVLQSIDG